MYAPSVDAQARFLRGIPVLAALASFALASAAFAAGSGETARVQHRFIKGGCGSGSVAIVAPDGAIEWEYPTSDETSDTWVLPGGHVVFSFKHGAREVDRDRKTVWEYVAPSNAEVHACQPLDDGWFLLGESHAGVSLVFEMNAKFERRVEFAVPHPGASPHAQFRQIRKTPQGTYLVTSQRGGGKALEYDAKGKLVREFPGGRYVAVRLPDGNTLLACGDEHRLIEVDPQNRIVWQIAGDELPGNSLAFVAGVHRLANGNTVVCNWPGHGSKPGQPQVFEVTRDKKVVWELRDPRLKMISSIGILDDGDPLRHASWR